MASHSSISKFNHQFTNLSNKLAPIKKKNPRLTDTLSAVDVAEESFVAVKFSRTLLARVAPSFAHRCATKLFRANNTLQLSLTHVVVDFRETRTRPVIFKNQKIIIIFNELETAVHPFRKIKQNVL
jgi:hypothetical protein